MKIKSLAILLALPVLAFGQIEVKPPGVSPANSNLTGSTTVENLTVSGSLSGNDIVLTGKLGIGTLTPSQAFTIQASGGSSPLFAYNQQSDGSTQAYSGMVDNEASPPVSGGLIGDLFFRSESHRILFTGAGESAPQLIVNASNATVAVDGSLTAATVQATATSPTATNGVGAEIACDGSIAYFLGYDRDTSAFIPSRLWGSTVELYAEGGSANIVVSGTGVTIGLKQMVPVVYPFTPTTGFTISAPSDFADQTHYLTPAVPLATGAFILPNVANSIDGQFIRVFTDRAITAFTFTVSGSGVIQGSSTGLLGTHDTATFQRVSSAGNGTWIRIRQ